MNNDSWRVSFLGNRYCGGVRSVNVLLDSNICESEMRK